MIPLNKLNKRIARITGNTELAAVIEAALGQPLLFHPGDAEAYARAFLSNQSLDVGALVGASAYGTSVQTEITEDGIGILYIAGAMVAHEMSVPCGRSPVSYEAIRHELDTLHANPEVSTIVARFNTGGGVASQCFDLSDHIYSMRGKGKKMYAMLDDRAYSAGYALASAFDEVWLTRSGGAGSIGVAARFESREKANEMAGKAVEYLYAGDKKVFGNADFPLSDAARAESMGQIQQHYELFTATASRNLGMDQAKIVATQAGVYMGQAAIDAGLAHKLGTFEDLVKHINGDTNMSTRTAETIRAEMAETQATLEAQREELAKHEPAPAAEPAATTPSTPSTPSAAPAATTPATPATPSAAPAAATPATEPAATTTAPDAAALASEREAGIRAVCGIAKVDEGVAANFVASSMTVEEVRASVEASTALAANTNIDSNVDTKPVTAEAKAQAEKHAAGWQSAIDKSSYK